MNFQTFSDRLDDVLNTERYADIDGSPNGMQVGDGDWSIERAAFAVDAAAATIDAAIDADADVLVTHHGLWWEGTERLTGPTLERVKRLVAAELGLYVSHLPLDGHPAYGNAAGVADCIALVDTAPFGEYHGEHIGRRGRFETPTDRDAVVSTLVDELDTGEGTVRVLPFGPDRIETVGIVTGDGTDWFEAAVAADLDAFITGEGAQWIYHEAREHGINVLCCGHYATETFGVRSLAALVADWDVSTTYIDHPTGI